MRRRIHWKKPAALFLTALMAVTLSPIAVAAFSSNNVSSGLKATANEMSDSALSEGNYGMRLGAAANGATSASISYHLNGGTNSEANPSSYVYGIAVDLEDPTKDGYKFVGWYTDAEFTNKITSISASQTGDLTLYACWSTNNITVCDDDVAVYFATAGKYFYSINEDTAYDIPAEGIHFLNDSSSTIGYLPASLNFADTPSNTVSEEYFTASIVSGLLSNMGATAATGIKADYDASEHTVTFSPYYLVKNSTLQTAINNAVSGATVVLGKHFTERISIASEKTITLDLNGFVLNGNRSGTTIINNGNLTVVDSGSQNPHNYFVVKNESIKWNGWPYNPATTGEIWYYTSSTPDASTSTIYDLDTLSSRPSTGSYIRLAGSITGGGSTGSNPSGAGINNYGTLTINGGNVVGNFDRIGGGVANRGSGKFILLKGNIVGNRGIDHTGGVLNDESSSFTMKGGRISFNFASMNWGGVAIRNSSSDNCVTGGEISYNLVKYNNGVSADGRGAGGVYTGSGSLTMSGGSIIYNEVIGGYGGGIWIGDGAFKMTGGIVSKNCSSGYGGGIYCYGKGGISFGGKASVTDNKLTGSDGANNVYLLSGKYISLMDGDDAPASGMSVDVTMQTPGTFVSSGASVAYENYFVSDDTDYISEYSGGALRLVTIASDAVARVTSADGTIEYYSPSDSENNQAVLQRAINNATSGATVKLLNDVECSSIDFSWEQSCLHIAPNQNVVLDLNGKTITGCTSDQVTFPGSNHAMNVLAVRKDSTLIINDSSSAQTGKIVTADNSDASDDPRVILVRGNLTINGGTYYYNPSPSSSHGVWAYATGSIQVNGGIFKSYTGKTLNEDGTPISFYYSNGATASIAGGTFDFNPATKLSNTIQTGYHAVNNGNGTWSVEQGGDVSKLDVAIGGTDGTTVTCSVNGTTITSIAATCKCGKPTHVITSDSGTIVLSQKEVYTLVVAAADGAEYTCSVNMATAMATASLDTTALETAIANAEAAVKNVVASSSTSLIGSTSSGKTASQSSINALNKAIAEAKTYITALYGSGTHIIPTESNLFTQGQLDSEANYLIYQTSQFLWGTKASVFTLAGTVLTKTTAEDVTINSIYLGKGIYYGTLSYFKENGAEEAFTTYNSLSLDADNVYSIYVRATINGKGVWYYDYVSTKDGYTNENLAEDLATAKANYSAWASEQEAGELNVTVQTDTSAKIDTTNATAIYVSYGNFMNSTNILNDMSKAGFLSVSNGVVSDPRGGTYTVYATYLNGKTKRTTFELTGISYTVNAAYKNGKTTVTYSCPGDANLKIDSAYIAFGSSSLFNSDADYLLMNQSADETNSWYLEGSLGKGSYVVLLNIRDTKETATYSDDTVYQIYCKITATSSNDNCGIVRYKVGEGSYMIGFFSNEESNGVSSVPYTGVSYVELTSSEASSITSSSSQADLAAVFNDYADGRITYAQVNEMYDENTFNSSNVIIARFSDGSGNYHYCILTAA